MLRIITLSLFYVCIRNTRRELKYYLKLEKFSIEKLEIIVEYCPVIFIIFIMKIFIEDYQDLIFKGLIYLEIKFVKEDRSREEKRERKIIEQSKNLQQKKNRKLFKNFR